MNEMMIFDGWILRTRVLMVGLNCTLATIPVSKDTSRAAGVAAFAVLICIPYVITRFSKISSAALEAPHGFGWT